jgi:hypothetical protein
MALRRAELLIKQIQRATENERVGANDGISLEEYYQYLTDGQRFIQAAIIANKSKRYRTATTWDADGVEEQDLPFDILSPEAISNLEYSSSGLAADYRRIDRKTQLERWSDTGVPFQYILEGSVIKVNAYPATGSFRLTYQKKLPSLDKRRASVLSHTKSATALTALALSGYTDADYLLFDYLTVVGWDGTVKMRGVPYTAVASGVVTVQGGSYTFPTGSTLTNTTDYVCLGDYATTHPQVDDCCEGVLLLYGQKRILNRDSSDDAILHAADMQELMGPMLSNYEPDDIEDIPIVNSGDWSMD